MTVWHFDTTEEAYDACQCDDRLKDGDTLVCGHYDDYILERMALLAPDYLGNESDVVVGIVSTWPTAVTKINGQLHKFKDPHTVQLNAMSAKTIVSASCMEEPTKEAAFLGVIEALKIADNMGLELDDGFVCPNIVEEMNLHCKDFSALANGSTRK